MVPAHMMTLMKPPVSLPPSSQLMWQRCWISVAQPDTVEERAVCSKWRPAMATAHCGC